MPHSTNTKKSASGAGTIRKKTVLRNGKEYSYWEGRYTCGYDSATGKQKQKSISGKTQKEVAQKLRQITTEIDHGTYIEPCTITVEGWMNEWYSDFLVGPKESTKYCYKRMMELYIIPVLGKVKLCKLTTPIIQRFYNGLSVPSDVCKKGLSPKSIKDVHGVLHQALNQAVANGMIHINPSEACKLPKSQRMELTPLEGRQITDFLKEIKGHTHQYLYMIALFTGLREGELLGLTWDNVNLDKGFLIVKQQLRKSQEKGGEYYFSTPKNGKQRTIALAKTVIEVFKLQKMKQSELKKQAGSAWNNKFNLVFTNAVGDRLSYRTVYDCYKRIVRKIGLPALRFHDLRHSYAVMSGVVHCK